jgi:phosphatidylinositol-bisphosphatase
MFAAVFALSDVAPAITEISNTYVGTGLLWRMGNKGCVAIRMRVWDSYLVIVDSHLAADQDAVVRRNADFAEIVKRTEFPWTRPGDAFGAPGYVTGVALGEGLATEENVYKNLTGSTRDWREMGMAAGSPRPNGGASVFDAE